MPQEPLYVRMEKARTGPHAGVQPVQGVEVGTDRELRDRQAHRDVQRTEIGRQGFQQRLQQAFIGEHHGGAGAFFCAGVL